MDSISDISRQSDNCFKLAHTLLNSKEVKGIITYFSNVANRAPPARFDKSHSNDWLSVVQGFPFPPNAFKTKKLLHDLLKLFRADNDNERKKMLTYDDGFGLGLLTLCIFFRTNPKPSLETVEMQIRPTIQMDIRGRCEENNNVFSLTLGEIKSCDTPDVIEAAKDQLRLEKNILEFAIKSIYQNKSPNVHSSCNMYVPRSFKMRKTDYIDDGLIHVVFL